MSAAGVEPAISGFVDRRLLHSTTSTSCCCGVRALGLEPSLFRGTSPVPHQSGVTRKVGREGIEPPMSEDRWFTARCAAMARPTHVGPICDRSLVDDASVVVKLLMSRLVVGRIESRLGRSRTSGHRFWRPRHHRGSSPSASARMTLRVAAGAVPSLARSAAPTSARRVCRFRRSTIEPALSHD